jgi:hypothetical protein
LRSPTLRWLPHTIPKWIAPRDRMPPDDWTGKGYLPSSMDAAQTPSIVDAAPFNVRTTHALSGVERTVTFVIFPPTPSQRTRTS